jgi:hypothetical protein
MNLASSPEYPVGPFPVDASRTVRPQLVPGARELAEEAGCDIDPADLQLFAIADVGHRGTVLSMSWNFTAETANAHLGSVVPDAPSRMLDCSSGPRPSVWYPDIELRHQSAWTRTATTRGGWAQQHSPPVEGHESTDKEKGR